MVRVVCLTGYKRSGKDTFCSSLIGAFHSVVRIALADDLKIMLANFLGITVAQIEEFKEPHYRKPLQDLGTAKRREDPNYWLTLASHKIVAELDSGRRVVVPDVRLPNEVSFMRRMFDADVVRIKRIGQIQDDVHETERRIDEIEHDAVFECGSPAEVDTAAREYGKMLGWRMRCPMTPAKT